MKSVFKRSLSLFLAITIVFSSAYVGLSEVDFGSPFAVEVKAATFDQINANSVFIKQGAGTVTCTLCASVNMMRRVSMMRGDVNWATITEASAKPYAWISGTGLSGSFNYSNSANGIANISVTCNTLPGNSSNTSILIDLLARHPEGIVIYNGVHAVLLTDYTNGVFYCNDPDDEQPVGRVTANRAYSVRPENATKYWYVSSPSVSLDNYTVPPTNAWVSLPNGNESSYLVNTDVPIKIGANNARYYTIVMYRDGEHYYEETFYNESGSHTIPASFDKTGHYSCYVIARYTQNGEFVTSSWQGWDIVDDVPQNLTVSVNKPLDRDFYPGETVKVTANATYGYQKYVCIHRADGSFYAGNYVNGTDFSCVINEPGEYYVNFEAFNACGSNLSKDLYFTVADVDAYIILPDSVGYSYLVNEEVPMKMVAPGATHFRIVMEKDGEFYYENLFYNESGSHTIPASFDKTGHYTGYVIATNDSGMEVVSEVYSWDVVNDVPQNLSVSTNKSIYLPGETIEFTMNAEGGQKKYIGIHRADGSFFNGGYLIGDVYHMRITAPGDYYADFEAMNVCGNKISGKVYFSVKEIHPATEETLVDYSNSLIYTSVENFNNITEILELSDNADVTVFASQNLDIYGTGTVIIVYEGDTQVGVFDLIVNGDTNGDSVCDALDAAQVALVMNGQKDIDGLSKMAADSNHDDEINIDDYQAIVNKVVA